MAPHLHPKHYLQSKRQTFDDHSCLFCAQFSLPYLSLQSDPTLEDSSSLDGRDASLFGDGIESIASFCKHFVQTPWLMLFAFVKNCLPHLTHSSCGSPGDKRKIRKKKNGSLIKYATFTNSL